MNLNLLLVVFAGVLAVTIGGLLLFTSRRKRSAAPAITSPAGEFRASLQEELAKTATDGDVNVPQADAVEPSGIPVIRSVAPLRRADHELLSKITGSAPDEPYD